MGAALRTTARFIKNVIDKTRARIGAKFPMVRISSDEFFAGIEIDEAGADCDDAGAVWRCHRCIDGK